MRESLMFSTGNCECERDTLCATEMSNMTNLCLSGVIFQALNTPKLVFPPPRTQLGSLRRSPDPLVGREGKCPFPHIYPSPYIRDICEGSLGRGVKRLCVVEEANFHRLLLAICT